MWMVLLLLTTPALVEPNVPATLDVALEAHDHGMAMPSLAPMAAAGNASWVLAGDATLAMRADLSEDPHSASWTKPELPLQLVGDPMAILLVRPVVGPIDISVSIAGFVNGTTSTGQILLVDGQPGVREVPHEHGPILELRVPIPLTDRTAPPKHHPFELRITATRELELLSLDGARTRLQATVAEPFEWREPSIHLGHERTVNFHVGSALGGAGASVTVENATLYPLVSRDDCHCGPSLAWAIVGPPGKPASVHFTQHGWSWTHQVPAEAAAPTGQPAPAPALIAALLAALALRRTP